MFHISSRRIMSSKQGCLEIMSVLEEKKRKIRDVKTRLSTFPLQKGEFASKT